MFKMLLPRLVLFRKEVVQLWKAFFAPETPFYLKAATLFTAFYLLNRSTSSLMSFRCWAGSTT